jgi:hypothetical protein
LLDRLAVVTGVRFVAVGIAGRLDLRSVAVAGGHRGIGGIAVVVVVVVATPGDARTQHGSEETEHVDQLCVSHASGYGL